MTDQQYRRMFQKLAIVEIALTLVLAVVLFYLQAAPFIEAGPPESGDLYAYTWGFQFTVFALLWLPGTIVATAMLLAIQYPLLRTALRFLAAPQRSNYSLKRTDQSLRD